jgi:hypothetical protein
MRLQWLVTGRAHHVWAIVDESDGCLVMSMLAEVERDHPTLFADMGSLLLQYVPVYGVPWHDRSRARKLYKDEIFELKACEYVNKRKTIGLRVAFFFDLDTAVIICTHAFYKRAATPPEEVQRARRMRDEYFVAKPVGDRGLLEGE